jgi:hypothetical protein
LLWGARVKWESRGPITPALGLKRAFLQRLAVDFHSGTVALRMERSAQTHDALQTGFVLTGGNWNLPEEAERVQLRKGGRKHAASSFDLTILPGQDGAPTFPPVDLPDQL